MTDELVNSLKKVIGNDYIDIINKEKMRILICGNINQDNIMKYCIDHNMFKQEDQFDIGYEWDINKLTHLVMTNNVHFFHGVRCSVKDKKLDHMDIDIIFIDDEGSRPIFISEDGKIDEWVKGFFDQYDIALDRLIDGWDK